MLFAKHFLTVVSYEYTLSVIVKMIEQVTVVPRLGLPLQHITQCIVNS